MSRREKTPFRMEPFRVDDELHRSIRVENREDAASTVPLEEALLLDSAEQRRKLILSVLTDDPVQYYDLLEQARLNDDSEVVHYAATAMAQISKQADAALQRHAARFAADPKDPAVLAEYAAALEASLALGLAQGRAAQLQRQQLERLLKMQLPDQPKEEQYGLGCRLAKVQLELAEYAAAEQTLAELTARWPVRETPWLLRLRSAAARAQQNQAVGLDDRCAGGGNVAAHALAGEEQLFAVHIGLLSGPCRYPVHRCAGRRSSYPQTRRRSRRCRRNRTGRCRCPALPERGTGGCTWTCSRCSCRQSRTR
ncbi:hypothetical protein [Faecalibacterium hattorii]|uniref:hypothetical protein n=1 Tax=Faecalibacterium hattorii TaxID=2935520 RepID=UPI003AAD97A4